MRGMKYEILSISHYLRFFRHKRAQFPTITKAWVDDAVMS